MEADVVEGVGSRKDVEALQFGYGLHAQTAGNDDDVLRSFGDLSVQFLLCLDAVAEEVHGQRSCDLFTLCQSKFFNFLEFRFL